MRRRTFLRSLGLVAAVPVLRNVGRAAEPTPGTASAEYRVLTCNIRVALPDDEATGNGWSARRDLCIDVIRAQKPDLICLQEVLREQILDLEKAFTGFGSFGFDGPEMDARMIGYQGIAKNPIMYSRARYDLVTCGGFWLSKTPHIPGSNSWDSARPRSVNWVRLRDRTSGRRFRVINTHLDHVGQRAREEQIKLILAEAATYADDFPQILAGDFNATRINTVLKLALDGGWTNTQASAPQPVDDGSTTHGFLGDKAIKSEAAIKRGPIDFILTRGPIATLGWKIVRDSRDGRYPSDHYFVAARLRLT
jgi:endonuclease/exonuclease/phosphatase family metal-dependent hydrolase